MKSTPYVQLSYQEAISGKREILSSQAEILQILKSLQNYRSLRKKELTKKNKLKLILNKTKKRIKTYLHDIPEVEQESFDIEEPKFKSTSRKITINSELKNIQDKLNKLKQ